MAAFETIAIATAEDLLEELAPQSGEVWRAARENPLFLAVNWIFRGQGDAAWPLAPSAMRGGAFGQFRGDAYEPAEANEHRGFEWEYVHEFAENVDRLGLAVPGDDPALRDRRVGPASIDPMEFPPIPWLHVFALAQHNGVPTRLLDWTRLPLMAAYFAARGCIDEARRRHARGQALPESFAVWCLQRDFLGAVAFDWDPRIIVVTAPSATNSNLHAQGGLFTLVQPRSTESASRHPLPTIENLVDANAGGASAEWTNMFPILRKLVVPAKQARTLLMLLDLHGISAATVYPGLAGVVESMREREKLHQRALDPNDRTL